MARRRTILVLLALVLPVAASSAEARGGYASRSAVGPATTADPLVRALAVAERYWRAVPCGGRITVLADQPLAPGLDPSTDAWVTFGSSRGADDLAAPAATYTDCTISLARWQWPTTATMRGDWPMLCLTVTHEVGHLLGHPHSSRPRSVMAPVFTDESNVPPVCRRTGPASAAHFARG
jgi:Matrixin